MWANSGNLRRLAEAGDLTSLVQLMDDLEGTEPAPPSETAARSLRRPPLQRNQLVEAITQTLKGRLSPPSSLAQRVSRMLVAREAFPDHARIIQTSLQELGVKRVEDLDHLEQQWQVWAEQVLAQLKDPIPAQPFGYLHLERLDFIPAGVDHGELVYSLPLAPSERISIRHKEWSNTSEEFTKLVRDQFEDYSETGVVNTTDLSSASATQSSHSSATSVSVSASGGYGPMGASVTASYAAQQSDSQSRQEAVRRTASITKKASARSRREHRISFKTATRTGIEDETVRVIVNPDPVNPVRYDFFQLMRRWRVDLRRYGIRLTYDLVVPEPGAALLAIYDEIAEIEVQLSSGPKRSVQLEAITPLTWFELAGDAGIELNPPPAEAIAITIAKVLPATEGGLAPDAMSVSIPEGYDFYDYEEVAWMLQVDAEWISAPDITAITNVSAPLTVGDLSFALGFDYTRAAAIVLTVVCTLREEHYQAWQMKCYKALAEAAQSRIRRMARKARETPS